MPRTVLVIDDLCFYRARLRNLLRQLGYVVYEAGDAEEGCRLAVKVKPDVVLLDQVMPDRSGLEAYERIRESGYVGTIFVLSPRPEAPDAQAFLRAGARGLLPKAVTVGVIESELRQAFGSASAA
jgi:DNA-binding NarL/FixJ family response regulator